MRVVIIGAAGMDYHVFNRVYRDNPLYEVQAFTMAVEQNLGTGMSLGPLTVRLEQDSVTCTVPPEMPFRSLESILSRWHLFH